MIDFDQNKIQLILGSSVSLVQLIQTHTHVSDQNNEWKLTMTNPIYEKKKIIIFLNHCIIGMWVNEINFLYEMGNQLMF